MNDASPMPPLELRQITAAPDEATFSETGAYDIRLFLDLYDRYAACRPARPRVLDLGCGCGRLTRHLDGNDGYAVSACDLNPRHVAWCRENLLTVETRQNFPAPPLPFPRASFDLVYALSVMTHLPEHRALAWVAEIASVLAPGGIAIITTHGYPALDITQDSAIHQEMMAMTREQVEATKAALPTTGYAYTPYTREVQEMANVGTDYGISFTDGKHASRAWAAFLEPIDHIEGGLRGWQDVFVLGKRTSPHAVAGAMPTVEKRLGAVSHIQKLTSQAARQRFDQLVAADPGLLVVSWMVGERVWEYAHAVGPRDKQFRALVPNIPPQDLRSLVAAPEEEVFLWTGAVDLENFLNCFDRHHALTAGSSVFDFGCGCGRLSRYFENNLLYKGYASDINPVLVQWCKKNLTAVDTRLNTKNPPLPFGDAMFDCAYALSIFTHLPDDAARTWLEEVSRVVKPNGVFIFTIHGHAALEIIKKSPVHMKMFSLTAEEAAEIQRVVSSSGFWYVKYAANMVEAANAGDDYGSSFLSEAYIRNWLGNRWDLIEFIPAGLRGWHDMVVLRRK